MKIKKANAVLSLLSTLGLAVHISCQAGSYYLFESNHRLLQVTGMFMELMILLHMILSAYSLFVSHDSKTIRYKKLNIRTYMQRITALAIVILLPLHILNMKIVSSQKTAGIFVIFEIIQVLFFAAALYHFALSFGNSLVSLGFLEDRLKKSRTDKAMLVVATVILIVASILIIPAQYNKMLT